MNIDRKNVLLFIPSESSRYAPELDIKKLGYTKDEIYYITRNFFKPDFDFNKYPLKYRWNLSSFSKERKIRTFDCFYGSSGETVGRAFLFMIACWNVGKI